VKDLTENNFGVIIAFLLPGFVLLYGLSYSSNDVALWLAKSSDRGVITVDTAALGTLRVCKDLSRVSPGFGAVRFRKRPAAAVWSVEYFGDASAL
jgi:hypothetical protein